MSRKNRPTKGTGPKTHEGAPADHIGPELELRRQVLSCLLWEDTFYEGGLATAERIFDLVERVDPDIVVDIAVEARNDMKLRHVPLLLAVALVRSTSVRALIRQIVRRPDEMGELLAIYRCFNPDRPIANSIKRGLADVYPQFDAYQLAKWNRKAEFTLRDVMFLVHPKPTSKEQEETWKKLIDGTLEPPETWEVKLSAGMDKKEVFEGLLRENKLGDMATIINLRNMVDAGVSRDLIEARLAYGLPRCLPFRFITAARMVPGLEPPLERAMLASIDGHPELKGHTILLVDVSGSMTMALSSRSITTRLDAACGLSVLLRELGDVEVWTFSNDIVEVAPRRGFALRDAICSSQGHRQTHLGAAVELLKSQEADRLIVITDEQAHDKVPEPSYKGYCINVASYQRGVSYQGNWTHIDGWSEAVVRYIQALENLELLATRRGASD